MALIPEDDTEFLTEKGYEYELVEVGKEVHLILHRFPFPLYAPQEADVLIRLLSGYPQTAVDMFYTIPDVKLPSGAFPLNCAGRADFGGRSWQQWSRHIAWRSGTDNLRTFLRAVTAEIQKGV